MKIKSIKTGWYGERRMTKVRMFLHSLDAIHKVFTHSHPYKSFRKLILPEVFKRLGIEPEKVSWSQKAGCSCGCSPGYVLTLNPEKVGYEAIWVSISNTKNHKLER